MNEGLTWQGQMRLYLSSQRVFLDLRVKPKRKALLKKKNKKKKKGSLGTLHGPDLGLCMSSLYTRESGLSFTGSCQMQQ